MNNYLNFNPAYQNYLRATNGANINSHPIYKSESTGSVAFKGEMQKKMGTIFKSFAK